MRNRCYNADWWRAQAQSNVIKFDQNGQVVFPSLKTSLPEEYLKSFEIQAAIFYRVHFCDIEIETPKPKQRRVKNPQQQVETPEKVKMPEKEKAKTLQQQIKELRPLKLDKVPL